MVTCSILQCARTFYLSSLASLKIDSTGERVFVFSVTCKGYKTQLVSRTRSGCVWSVLVSVSPRHRFSENCGEDGRKPGLYNCLVQKIDADGRNDQILKVTVLNFESYVSFGVGSNSQLSRGGSIFSRKVAHME